MAGFARDHADELDAGFGIVFQHVDQRFGVEAQRLNRFPRCRPIPAAIDAQRLRETQQGPGPELARRARAVLAANDTGQDQEHVSGRVVRGPDRAARLDVEQLHLARELAERVQAETGERRDAAQQRDPVGEIRGVRGARRIGLAENLIRPPRAKDGTRDLSKIATSTPAGCAQRLARAEEILRENAAQAHERISWKAHAGNVALNLAGALVVAEGFGDEKSAWQSGALGFVVGEGRIWSYPWHARSTLD